MLGLLKSFSVLHKEETLDFSVGAEAWTPQGLWLMETVWIMEHHRVAALGSGAHATAARSAIGRGQAGEIRMIRLWSGF